MMVFSEEGCWVHTHFFGTKGSEEMTGAWFFLRALVTAFYPVALTRNFLFLQFRLKCSQSSKSSSSISSRHKVKIYNSAVSQHKIQTIVFSFPAWSDSLCFEQRLVIWSQLAGKTHFDNMQFCQSGRPKSTIVNSQKTICCSCIRLHKSSTCRWNLRATFLTSVANFSATRYKMFQ